MLLQPLTLKETLRSSREGGQKCKTQSKEEKKLKKKKREREGIGGIVQLV